MVSLSLSSQQGLIRASFLGRKGRGGGGRGREKGIDIIKTRSTQHQSKKVNRLFNSSNSNQATQLSARCSSKVSDAAFSKAKSELPARLGGRGEGEGAGKGRGEGGRWGGGLGRWKTPASKNPPTRAHAGRPSPPLPSPRPDSIHSKDAHPAPLGCVQVKPISVNFPTRLSAQITRAPNAPVPGIWFPFPPPTPSPRAPPSYSLKIQKSLDRGGKPAQHRAERAPGLPAAAPAPQPRWKRSLRPRLPPRIRLSLHLGLPGSPKPEIHSLRQGFDLPTLPGSREASRPVAPAPPASWSRKPYKTGSETVSRYHCLCQESQTRLTSSLFFPKAKSLI